MEISFKKNIICNNCGKYGHYSKKCFLPITSYGIICFRKNNISESYDFLLVRRKDSLAFAEFLRLRFSLYKFDYILKLLSNMTFDEQNFLKNSKSPERVWARLWGTQYIRLNEFNKIKKKLFLLLNGYQYNNQTISIKKLIEKINNGRVEPEWGFPKGRKLLSENNINCAIREFCEETDIDRKNINIINSIYPVKETFKGTNGVLYKHIYYIANLKNNNIELTINSNNKHQKYEIGDIGWFSIENTIRNIENINKERISLFKNVINSIFTLNKKTISL